MDAIYAVGDIHGQAGELERVLRLIDVDGGSDQTVVFVGDYTDRGPNSRDVLDILVDGLASGRNWVTLKGNHDRMFEWFMEDEPRGDPHMLVGIHWFHDVIGGLETVQSYGVDGRKRQRLKELHEEMRAAVPASHVAFLKALKLSHETEAHYFCHAGIRPGIALDAQEEEDLVWIRDEFLDNEDTHPKLIVHGHTPVDRARHYGNRVNLDSGAGYGHPLSAVVLERDDCFLLTPEGRQPV